MLIQFYLSKYRSLALIDVAMSINRNSKSDCWIFHLTKSYHYRSLNFLFFLFLVLVRKTSSFVCLFFFFFVWFFFFFFFFLLIIIGEGLQFFTYARQSMLLSSEISLAFHSYCNTRQSVFNGHLRRPVTINHFSERFVVELSLTVFTT